VVKEPSANASIEISENKWYEIDVKEKLFVTVLPDKNSDDVKFEMKYRLKDPIKANWYMSLYIKLFHGPKGKQLKYIAMGCGGVLALLILCCLYMFLRKLCSNGEEGVDDSSNKVDILSIK